MTETLDIPQQQPATEQSQGASPATVAEMTAPQAPLPDMKGRVNRHTSGYWALTIPALSVRYLAEAGANVIAESRDSLAKHLKFGWVEKLAAIKDNKKASQALDKKEATLVGTFMMGVSAFYMTRTYKDIKGAFAEAVSWETGKKTEDVGFRDLVKSDNTLVEAARHNFFKYNARRFAVNIPFFSNKVFTKTVMPKDAILFGTASNSLYLMHDVLNRKETFFERLQSFVDQKIVHSEQIGDRIKPIDLINLYELHARDKNPKYKFNGRMDTQEWQNKMKVFGRMADLLNETYANAPNKDGADFTLSKMIYLMGHGMVDAHNPDRSLALIEVANLRGSRGIDAVKDVVKHSSANGADVAYAREHYLNGKQPVQEQPKPEEAGFTKKFTPEAAMTNAEKVAAQKAAANQAAFVQTA